MEDYQERPSEIDRSLVLKTIRKRKFQAEQLGFPISKYKCWEQKFPSDLPISMFDENPEVQKKQTHIIKVKVEGVALDDGSEFESAKDSNSFTGDSDSAMSVYSEAKLEPAYPKTYPYDRPSTSSADCIGNNLKDISNSLESITVMKAASTHPDGGIQPFHEFGKQANYICSEYGDDFIEECTDKEVEDILFSNSLNPNTYVLSSGRWSVTQEADQSASSRKPTIDQEFEQYFSMLML